MQNASITTDSSILIIEDEEALLMRYSDYAKKIFTNIFTATTIKDAKKILSTHKISCIFK